MSTGEVARPAKRRKTASPSPPAPHRRASSSPVRSPHGTGSSLRARRNLLAGFDDEEELPAQTTGQGPGVDRRKSGAKDDAKDADDLEQAESDEEEHCAICLSPIENKTVIFPCHHGQFCWNCIRAWTDQSRKCPLCLGHIEHLIYNIRSENDYQIHALLPLHTVASTSSTSHEPLPPRGDRPCRVQQALPRHALYGRNRYSMAARRSDEDETTWRERQAERELERRRYIYREGLYAKHVASNRYTGFKPFSPQAFATNAELKAKVIKFIRRELQVFPTVDVAFLTTYLVSIASQLDLRSSAAIRLISDFLSEPDAQHLVHEITTFARSPFRSLDGYDRFVQYGRPYREGPPTRGTQEALDGRQHKEGPSPVAPRFEEHMRRRRSSSRVGYDASERRDSHPPPRPSSQERRPPDESSGSRRGQGRSPSPRPRRRQPRRSEPDWRDRDERYTGSYCHSNHHRRDGRAQRSEVRRPAGEGRRRSRSRSRSPQRYERRDSERRSRTPSPRSRRRRPEAERDPPRSRRRSSFSPSPSAAAEKLPRPVRTPSSTRSRTLQPESCSSPSRAGSRGRSSGNDDDNNDLAHTVARVDPSPSSSSARPTLSILGAARRRPDPVGGFGADSDAPDAGRAHSAIMAASPSLAPTASRDADDAYGDSDDDGERATTGTRRAMVDGRDGNRDASPVDAQTGPSDVRPPSPKESGPEAAATATTEATQRSRMRAQLQARLTAEYRQALLALRATTTAAAEEEEATTSPAGSEGRAPTISPLSPGKEVPAQIVTEQPTEVEGPSGGGGGGAAAGATARERLLARLAKERVRARRSGGGPGAEPDVLVRGGADQDDAAPDGPANPASVTAPPSETEATLRARVLAAAARKRQTAAVEADLDRQGGLLREKLVRQKLLLARRQKQQQQQQEA